MTKLLILTVLTGAASSSARAQSYSLIYSFQCGVDGAYPFAGLLSYGGNFYGTTSRGGKFASGTVFELTTAGTETVLHSFPSSPMDGYYPTSGLVRGADGNFYGTTDYGGQYGDGTVFRITPAGKETILYSFRGKQDGSAPNSLIQDTTGTFYGTTYGGGAFGYGTVFRLTSAGVETVLHSFQNTTTDGGFPFSGVVIDAAGNLYGTTYNGGASGLGTIFQVTPAGSATVFHSFTGALADGASPASGLIIDSSGNLFGTTSFGGQSNLGTIFEWGAGGTEVSLHGFSGGLTDGNDPAAGLLLEGGTLYGTTLLGGSTGCGNAGCGVVFSLNGTVLTLLHSFGSPPADGHFSYGTLVQSTLGNLYGTTYIGGASKCGAVFTTPPSI